MSRMGTVVSIALLSMVLSATALSQTTDSDDERDQAQREADHARFEAEYWRQQQAQYESTRIKQERQRFVAEQLRQENELREQERLRLETEQLRQASERREQERLRVENERLRLENERHELEQLRFETAARDRQRMQTAAVSAQMQAYVPAITTSDDPDIYEQLRAIGQLKDDGILTEEEFQRLKQKILN